MQKLYSILILLTLISQPADKEVYICDSKTATKYHYNDKCRGLSNCKHDIVKIKLTVAEKDGRTLCGWED